MRLAYLLGWCVVLWNAHGPLLCAADPASDDAKILASMRSRPTPTEEMHAHQLAAQHVLLTSIALPEVAEEDPARQEALRLWSADWCCRVAGLADDTSPETYCASLERLVRSGCRAPVALYAYARLLQSQERHREAQHLLQEAADILGDHGDGYLTFLVFLSQLDEEDFAFKVVAKASQARAVSRLLSYLQDGSHAPLEQGVIGTLLQRDYFRESVILTGSAIPTTTINIIADQIVRRPTGSAWFRAMVRATHSLVHMRELAGDGADVSGEIAEVIAACSAAWQADPRFIEPSLAALEAATFDHQDVDVSRWIEAGLQAAPGSTRLIDAYFGVLDTEDGEHQHLLRFARQALANRQFDTAVPELYLRALLCVDHQLEGHSEERRGWWNPARWEELQDLVNGEIDAAHDDPARCRYWQTIRIAAAVRCGVDARQRRALHAATKELDPKALSYLDVQQDDIDAP